MADRMFSNAEAYERLMGRWSQRLAVQLLEFAGVRDGDRVLDVGSGTGSLALATAAATRRSEVVGIEPTVAFVEYARARTTDARLRFEVGDAQDLPYSEAAFDRTLACLVLMFVPDAPRAVAEMRRVTRPAGTVVACVWDVTGGMELTRVFWDGAVALDPSAEPRRETHMPYSRPGELADLWRGAGLADVEETGLIIPLEFASYDDFWEPFLLGQGPPGVYVAGLDATRRSALHEQLRRNLFGTQPDGPFTLRARAWAVRGTRP
ncbi:MAG: class I SAM-dependent methyltransferase [Candidatus Rokuibacteriota bacterium]